jgi:hypothetical protein
MHQELVSFALPPTTQRWSYLAEPPPDDTTLEWPGRTFIRLREARGHIVDKALHHTMLARRRVCHPHRPTHRDQDQAIYQRWG